jgi:hypothetical protein
MAARLPTTRSYVAQGRRVVVSEREQTARNREGKVVRCHAIYFTTAAC